ncbi:class I SAM-dependent methyltransferase [Mucilaginibacter roseus]|uniref:Class I SAM-dependent methyltransferase n=1 Tax=Mucilaginibacter roseus TaxID=1528868 RepID=A0ABS8U1I3_9SPHI|nr:class I SAM-dependent methyltransferase [Mucilaginibacter roseus]MCD8740980.1 class I SAM-dependent methyltransferase [Mucilaginibacter roseus]
MAEFWEKSFQDKQEMWGWEPADSVAETVELFKRNGLNKILIPGFGYGRNAKPFYDNGFNVTGIEISETAIDLAKNHFGESVKIHHGPVGSMPFDQELYNGVFCYSLIHLLGPAERSKLIAECYQQLETNGYMVFITISKNDPRYREGEIVDKDTIRKSYGVTLYFYDPESIQADFGDYGLIEAREITEPKENLGNKPTQRFWYIVCKK